MGGDDAAEKIHALQARLGHVFADPSLLRLALTHSSVANESDERAHNERLEFLGDSIVDFVLSNMLYTAFPAAAEGELSRLRASAVNQTALAAKAREVGLGSVLRLGQGERRSGGASKDSLLADAYEAVVAALFLDGGADVAFAFVQKTFAEDLPRLETNDPKTDLQHYCQKHYRQLPKYVILAEAGPEHDRAFQCAVSVEGKELGRGEGRSKKLAEQAAARDALLRL